MFLGRVALFPKARMGSVCFDFRSVVRSAVRRLGSALRRKASEISRKHPKQGKVRFQGRFLHESTRDAFRALEPGGVGALPTALPRTPSELEIKIFLHNLLQPLTKREKTILKSKSNGDTCHHIQKFNYHSNPSD